MPKIERDLLLLGGAIALYLVWKGYQGAEKIVTEYANPAHQGNVVNQGVTAIGEAVTGKPGWSLGGFIYDTVDSVQDILPFVDSDREKRAKLEAQYREQYRKQADWRTGSYNKLPEIF